MNEQQHDDEQRTSLYGPKAAPPPSEVTPSPARTSKLAILSLVLAFGFLSPVAVVLGFVSRRRIQGSNGELKGNGLATAGIAISSVVTVLLLVGAAIGTYQALNPISRSDFVDKVATAIDGSAPSGLDDDTRDQFGDATREYAGCVYDVLEGDSGYLRAFYDDPLADSAMIYGVTEERIAQLEDAIESTCHARFEERMKELADS